jgi:hypothetical protein
MRRAHFIDGHACSNRQQYQENQEKFELESTEK